MSLAFGQVVFRVASVLKAAGFDRLQRSHLQLGGPPRWYARGSPQDNQHSINVVFQSTSGYTSSFGHWVLFLTS